MKENTWNVRCLVDELFVPSAQRTSLSYCRLSDFWLADVLIVFPRGRALVTITRVKLKEQSKQKKTEDLPWTHDALFFNIIL
jgi:hypothetical protein